MADKQLNGGKLGFEEKLWAAADKMRGSMDASEYKHVALGLIFLKYISDAFYEKHNQLRHDPVGDPEDRDEYIADNILWVPEQARWDHLQHKAKNPEIGRYLDDAMALIEQENISLKKGVLPKEFSKPNMRDVRLGELIDLIGTIGLGTIENREHDILGRVYEYFLGAFAKMEGKSGGEFFTPQSVVTLLVEMLEPYKGRVFDPCCGSGGMFVQSAKFVQAHANNNGNASRTKIQIQRDIAIYGQESNPTTWRLAMMNLAIRGIDADLAGQHADSFHNDLHKDLRADFILANPPFNMSDWGGERLKDDVRWKHGLPPKGNANFAWVQHIAHHLAPNGKAGFVLANGSLSSNQSQDASIRKSLIENDLVDCIVYLPTQLFYTTQISVSLWFLARNKLNPKERIRSGETLFIYAYGLGHLVDRTHRELSKEDIQLISKTYRTWRGSAKDSVYKDIPGFCKSAKNADILSHKSALVPGRYVGFDKSVQEAPDISLLRKELSEIKKRLSVAQSTSHRALSVLEELING